MLCGPMAVAHVTDLEVATIVTRINAHREAHKRHRVGRGGTRMSELMWAAAQHGWRIRRVFSNRRVPLATLAKRITRGRWIFYQANHFIGVRSARELRMMARRHPRAKPIVDGYRVSRLRAGPAR